MRAKIQGHGPFLMTPFILLYEAGDITKARRPPTIHFPEQRLFVVVGPTYLARLTLYHTARCDSINVTKPDHPQKTIRFGNAAVRLAKGSLQPFNTCHFLK
ncbi:hypothetical protein MTP99_015724 [Tenebrio molitor]|nr:hypothetical protein MTP99_015724 [Tenebrio molitor]